MGLKIVIIVNEFPPDRIAGTAMSTASLAKHLVRRGHHVRVLVTERKHSPYLEKLSGIEVRRLRRRTPKGLGWLSRLFFAYRNIAEFRPDIIHGQAVSCGLIGSFVGRLLRIPALTHAQGYDVFEASTLQRHTEIQWGIKLSDATSAVTKELSNKIQHISGRKDIPVIYNGFERFNSHDALLKVKRLKKDMQAQGPVVLSVGRLEVFKGHDVLLNAWPRVLTFNKNAQLWIAGDGSQRMMLEMQAKHLRVSETVRFLGLLSPEMVAATMSEADIFVLPSRSEPFGIVLLEAMDKGLPIVASDVGGIPEIIPHSIDAFLVSPDDPHVMSEKIIEALRCFKSPSKKNREWANTFLWEYRVQAFEQLYRNLCLAGKLNTANPQTDRSKTKK